MNGAERPFHREEVNRRRLGGVRIYRYFIRHSLA
jgi:hypothetical protein